MRCECKESTLIIQTIVDRSEIGKYGIFCVFSDLHFPIECCECSDDDDDDSDMVMK